MIIIKLNHPVINYVESLLSKMTISNHLIIFKIIISEGNLNLLSACTYSELCKGEGTERGERQAGGGSRDTKNC